MQLIWGIPTRASLQEKDKLQNKQPKNLPAEKKFILLFGTSVSDMARAFCATCKTCR